MIEDKTLGGLQRMRSTNFVDTLVPNVEIEYILYINYK